MRIFRPSLKHSKKWNENCFIEILSNGWHFFLQFDLTNIQFIIRIKALDRQIVAIWMSQNPRLLFGGRLKLSQFHWLILKFRVLIGASILRRLYLPNSHYLSVEGSWFIPSLLKLILKNCCWTIFFYCLYSSWKWCFQWFKGVAVVKLYLYTPLYQNTKLLWNFWE